MSKKKIGARGRRTEETGVVISTGMSKTISVEVPRTIRHAKYGKTLRSVVVFKAHDEKGTAKVGDKVLIFGARPLSKLKRWNLAKVLIAGFVRGAQHDTDANQA